MIDDHILKKLIQKMFSLPILPKKIRLIIHYNKFKTSNLIISNNYSLPLNLLIYVQMSNICSNVPWEIVSPTKIIRMLVSLLRLFQDGLQCTLICTSIALHLKTHSIPKSKFQKILVENTTIIAHKIHKLQLQILEALHIKG